jgi:hypothetical protein
MNPQPKPTREELWNLIKSFSYAEMMYYKSTGSLEAQEDSENQLLKALDRLYVTDWVKIEEGCVMPTEGSTIEVYGSYGSDIFIFENTGFNLSSAPHETHWRYATPPPTKTNQKNSA